jgi:hypothetical protein
MTPQGITVLFVGLIVFWVSVGVMVRVHRNHRGSARSARRVPGSHA